MLTFRLYGPKHGYSSWPRVAYGIMEGLVQSGVQVSWYDTSALLDDGDALTLGWDADVALYVGPPNGCAVIASRGRHKLRLAMVAANSSWLPEGVMRGMSRIVTGYLAPSSWAKDVLQTYAENLPVFLFQHGVSEKFRPELAYVSRMREQLSDAFRVAHFASTTMQRKGTDELIRAWVHLKKIAPSVWDNGKLDLYIEGSPGYAKKSIDDSVGLFGEFDRSSIQILDPVQLDEKNMCRLFQTYHVIAQPSRSEGFGLIPLEALCSGVPVVVTQCTGHLDYLEPDRPLGAELVSVRGDQLIDDGPGAMAPGLDFYQVATALSRTNVQWNTLAGRCMDDIPRLRSIWSWKEATARFVSSINMLSK